MCSNAGSGAVAVEPENDTARGRACRLWSCCHLYILCLKITKVKLKTEFYNIHMQTYVISAPGV
jgi:hypothetical protein